MAGMMGLPYNRYDPRYYQAAPTGQSNQGGPDSVNGGGTSMPFDPTNKLHGRVTVTGLTEENHRVSEEEIRQILSEYGEIEFVERKTDPLTKRLQSYATAQFLEPAKAKEAVEKLNGKMVNGKPIGVSLMAQHLSNLSITNRDLNAMLLDDEEETSREKPSGSSELSEHLSNWFYMFLNRSRKESLKKPQQVSSYEKHVHTVRRPRRPQFSLGSQRRSQR